MQMTVASSMACTNRLLFPQSVPMLPPSQLGGEAESKLDRLSPELPCLIQWCGGEWAECVLTISNGGGE